MLRESNASGAQCARGFRVFKKSFKGGELFRLENVRSWEYY